MKQSASRAAAKRGNKMKLGSLVVRLFNIIKTTENNNVGCVMSFSLCCGNYCLLIQNYADHNVLMPLGELAAGEEMYNRQTWLGNRPLVSRGFIGWLCSQ